MSRKHSTKASSAIAGARESHAGDEFHFVWAARKTVKLLDPQSGLCRLRVEGVTPVDEAATKRRDAFLAVDVTEYFGGQDFARAQRTVVSQLKYSTRHPDQEWTVGRLCRRERNKRSLFGSLACVYQGFRSRV